MSISAMSGELLEKRGISGYDDYLRSIPSVSLLSQGAGNNTIIIRGLGINQNDGRNSGPITGVYFGDTPISSLGIQGNNADIKLIDIERVEVLRGPQGTLYGAGAMAGVVRNIPKAPNLEEASGTINLGYSNTARLGGDNSDISAVFNLPLIEDQLAVRTVLYRSNDSGYYRNIAGLDANASQIAETFGGSAVVKDDIGRSEVTGGRVSVLWELNDTFSAEFSAVRQAQDQDGWMQGNLSEEPYEQIQLQARRGVNVVDAGPAINNEALEDDIEINQLTLTYDLGWAELSSTTSYVKEEAYWLRDLYSFGQPWSQNITYFGEATIEELRLVSSHEGPLQYIAGYYYEDRDTGFNALSFLGGTEADLALFGPSFDFRQFKLLKHQAVFGEVSYQLTDSMTFTAGARVFDQTRESTSAFTANEPALNPTRFEADADDSLFKAEVEYQPNDDLLIYALWSEGFRLGDVQPEVSPVSRSLPLCDDNLDGIVDGTNVGLETRSIDSDSVENFEIGAKVGLLDGRLEINASAYQIDWTNIPVSLSVCGGVAVNAGEARSQGIEFEALYYLESGLKINVGASYNSAELLGTTSIGNEGDSLPSSPDVSASLGLEYDFSISEREAFIRGDVSYVGEYHSDIQKASPLIGDYTKIDLSAGVALSDDVELSLFVQNATNEDSITAVNTEFFSFGVLRGSYLRPRTVGLKLGVAF